MASWILIPAAVALRNEFNAIAPNRDKASDGSVGDLAHQQEVSDHNPDETGNVPIHDADHINEVHAIDVDNSGPWPSGWTMERFVQFLLGECRAGREKRLRYIIYNRRIWSASSGWAQQSYTGASPHTEHVHFSFSYTTSLEADTSSYGLKELIRMPLDSNDKNWLKSAEFTGAVAAAARDALLNHKIDTTSQLNPNRTVQTELVDVQNLRDAFVHSLDDVRVKGRPLPGGGFDALVTAADVFNALTVDETAAALVGYLGAEKAKLVAQKLLA